MTPGSGPFAITTSEDGSVWIGKPEYRRMYCRDKLDARQFETLCSEMNIIYTNAYAAGQAAERERGAVVKAALRLIHQCHEQIEAALKALDAGGVGGADGR